MSPERSLERLRARVAKTGVNVAEMHRCLENARSMVEAVRISIVDNAARPVDPSGYLYALGVALYDLDRVLICTSTPMTRRTLNSENPT